MEHFFDKQDVIYYSDDINYEFNSFDIDSVITSLSHVKCLILHDEPQYLDFMNLEKLYVAYDNDIVTTILRISQKITYLAFYKQTINSNIIKYIRRMNLHYLAFIDCIFDDSFFLLDKFIPNVEFNNIDDVKINHIYNIYCNNNEPFNIRLPYVDDKFLMLSNCISINQISCIMDFDLL